jgi:hypothetical protein
MWSPWIQKVLPLDVTHSILTFLCEFDRRMFVRGLALVWTYGKCHLGSPLCGLCKHRNDLCCISWDMDEPNDLKRVLKCLYRMYSECVLSIRRVGSSPSHLCKASYPAAETKIVRSQRTWTTRPSLSEDILCYEEHYFRRDKTKKTPKSIKGKQIRHKSTKTNRKEKADSLFFKKRAFRHWSHA